MSTTPERIAAHHANAITDGIRRLATAAKRGHLRPHDAQRAAVIAARTRDDLLTIARRPAPNRRDLIETRARAEAVADILNALAPKETNR